LGPSFRRAERPGRHQGGVSFCYDLQRAAGRAQFIEQGDEVGLDRE